jgi:hypothetical protein
MSRSRSIRLSLAVLGSSLLLNIILVSCAAKAVLPPDQGDGGGGGGGGAVDNAELLARFDSVMARLTQIEAKVDQQAEQLQQQADAAGQHTVALSAKIDSLEATVTTQAADPTIALQQVARIDSLLNITSFIANDMTSAGWEVCGNVDAGLGLALTPNAELYGEAAADGGAWAGTGAFAGAEVHAGLGAELELGVNGGVTFGGCAPLFSDVPPSRGGASGSLNTASIQLRDMLEDAADQIGLTRSRIQTSLASLPNGIQSASTMRIQDAVNYLPLPGQLASIANDPIGHITRQIPSRVDDAVQILCSRNWGSVMAATVPVACDKLQNGPLNIGGFFSLFDQFPAMQTALNTVTDGLNAVQGTVATLQSGFGAVQGAVSGVQSQVSAVQDAMSDFASSLAQVQVAATNTAAVVTSVCSKVNQVGGASLTISNPLAIGPDNLFDGDLFPFYSPIGC